MKRKFTDLVSMVGTTPAYFSGEKRYVSTGAVDRFSINEADVEIVTYANRPSRANLSAQKNDILFAKMAETLKTLCLDDEQAENIYSTGFCAIRANEQFITPQCLYYLVSSPAFLSQKDKNASGATQRAITNTGLANIYVSIPSLDEQKEAIKNLDAISSLMAKRKKQLAEIEKLVKSQFIEMFGTCRTNAKGWTLCRLGNIADVGSSKRVFVEDLIKAGIPFYRGTEVGVLAEGKEIQPELFISEEHYQALISATGKPEYGDLLMPSICPDGRIWRVNNDKPFYFKDGRVLWVHLNNEKFNPVFIQHVLKDKFATDYANIASGTTFAELKIFALKDCSIFNVPIELQNEFARFVEQTDKSKVLIKWSKILISTLLRVEKNEKICYNC